MLSYDSRMNILHSEDTKNKISKIRKKYFKDHPEAKESSSYWLFWSGKL